MNTYNYRAKDSQGILKAGKIEAFNEKEAVNLLRSRNLIVIALTVQTEGMQLKNLFAFLQRVSLNDQVNFTRQLSTMINAGLPMTEALSLLRSQARTTTMMQVVDNILRDVEGGSSLAVAVGKHPEVFSKIYISLVKAGEAAGVLDQILMRLADNLEKERDFQGKVKGALVYPVIVIIGMMGVVFIMMIFVIPRLTSMYKDMGADLPLPTKILISLSSFLVGFWWLVGVGIVGLVVLFLRWKKTKAGKNALDHLMFKLPIAGPLFQQINLTEFTRTLGLLVGAGIPIIEALKIVSEAVDNVIYQDGIVEAARQVEKGFPLSQPLSQNSNFPALLGQMVKTGEETGKMDEILMRMSLFYESESERAIKGLTTAIEPIIMVVLGVGVAFLILSIILPIYKLTSAF